MVYKSFNLFNNLTVKENIMLAPVTLKLKTKEEAEKEAIKLLKKINLKDADVVKVHKRFLPQNQSDKLKKFAYKNYNK